MIFSGWLFLAAVIGLALARAAITGPIAAQGGSRTRRLLLAMVAPIGAIALATLASPATAESADASGPVIGSPSVELSAGPTVEPGEQVTVTVDVSDETGVAEVNAQFYLREDGNTSSGVISLTRTSSTTWRGTWTVPELVHPGTYYLWGIWARDAAPLQNTSSVYPGGPDFTVSNPKYSDSSGPVIGSPSVELSAGPTVEPGEQVTVTVDVSDETGVAEVNAQFYLREDGNTSSGVISLTRTSSTTWRGTWTVPELVHPGTYYLWGIWARDAAPLQNTSSVYPGGPDFTVSNPKYSDSSGPVIGSPSVELSAGPTVEPGEQVTVTVDVSDETGVAEVNAQFYLREDGNTSSGVISLTRTSSTTWRGTWTVPELVHPGTYYLWGVWARDAAPLQNTSSVYPGGPDFTVTQPAPLTPGAPQIAGAAKVGEVLTALPGDWGPGEVDLEYQWLRDGSVIPDAVGSTYLIVPADAGRGLSVRVTGSKTGYATTSRTAPPVTVAPTASTDTAPPVLSEFDFTPDIVDLAGGAESVTVTARVTDATGTEAPVLVLDSDATTQTVGFGDMSLVSGTTKDGVWSRTVSVPATAAPGDWTVTIYPLDDSVGNSETGFHHHPTKLTVSNGHEAPETLPPDAPGDVKAVRGNGAVTVTWTAPSDSGSPITSYTVAAAPGGKSVTVAGDTTTAVVTGLINGTGYTFTVTATNAAGTSRASAASASVTPATKPGRVAKPTAKVKGRKVLIRWSSPDDGGSALTGYRLVVKGQVKTVRSNVHRLVVRRLKPGTYTVKIAAINALGRGAAGGVKFRVRAH